MTAQLTAAQKQAILDLIPKDLPAADRLKLTAAIEKSTTGVDAGDGSKASEGITEFRAMMRALNNKWEDCGDHCQHHLDNGKAIEYGVCYWACIARGGPKKPSLTVVLRDVESRRR